MPKTQQRQSVAMVVTAAAFVLLTLVGASATPTAVRMNADPCPCDNPICRPACRQN